VSSTVLLIIKSGVLFVAIVLGSILTVKFQEVLGIEVKGSSVKQIAWFVIDSVITINVYRLGIWLFWGIVT
jgi:hypothetical protein